MTRGASRILLHVGAPKTGSTYLQRRLRADPDELRRQGVYVPVLPAVARMAGNAKLLATVLSDEPSLSFRHAFPEIDVGAIAPEQVVAELLADWRPDDEDVVLSAENFRPSHALTLRRLLPSWATIAVVLFVRRQDRWIESYHNQLVKTGDTQDRLEDFTSLVMAPPTDRLCLPDWLTHYEAWRTAFGDCRVVFFDEVLGDLWTALFIAAGMSAPCGIPEIPRQQESLDPHQYAYALMLDRSRTHPEFLRRRAASAEASLRLGAPDRLDLLLAERDRLSMRFSASNGRLLEALGRPADDQVLGLGPSGAPAGTIQDVLRSSAYLAHQRLADAIYAGEDAPMASARR